MSLEEHWKNDPSSVSREIAERFEGLCREAEEQDAQELWFD